MPKRFKKTSGRLDQNIEAFLKNAFTFGPKHDRVLKKGGHLF